MATSRSSCFGVVPLHVELGGGNQKHLLGVGPKGCVLQRGAGEQMDGGLEELLLRRGAAASGAWLCTTTEWTGSVS